MHERGEETSAVSRPTIATATAAGDGGDDNSNTRILDDIRSETKALSHARRSCATRTLLRQLHPANRKTEATAVSPAGPPAGPVARTEPEKLRLPGPPSATGIAKTELASTVCGSPPASPNQNTQLAQPPGLMWRHGVVDSLTPRGTFALPQQRDGILGNSRAGGSPGMRRSDPVGWLNRQRGQLERSLAVLDSERRGHDGLDRTIEMHSPGTRGEHLFVSQDDVCGPGLQALRDKIALFRGHKNELEAKLLVSTTELDVAQASLFLERSRRAGAHAQISQLAEEKQRAESERSEELGNLLAIIGPLQDLLISVNDSHAAQTMEFAAFVKEVKEQTNEAAQLLVGVQQVLADHMTAVLETNLEHSEMRGEVAEHCSSLRRRAREASRKALDEVQRCAELEIASTRGRQQTLRLEALKAKVLSDRSNWDSEYAQLRIDLAHEQKRLASKREEYKDTLTMENLRALKFSEEVERQAADGEARKIARQQRAMLRHLDRGIADEFFRACQLGNWLTKVRLGKRKKEWRFAKVFDSEKELRWSRSDKLRSRGTTVLDLEEVLQIDYGQNARGHYLYSDIPAWLCFSLYTTRRTYDFICPDEDVARIFIVSISRLISCTLGALPTRRLFICAMAWIKIDDYCSRNASTRGLMFLEAIRKVRQPSSEIAARLDVYAPPLPARSRSFRRSEILSTL